MTKDDVTDCRVVGCAFYYGHGKCNYNGHLHCEYAMGHLIEELDNFDTVLADIREAWRLMYEKSYPVR